jgi:uncharacterized protein (TIGR04222 family)
MQWLFDNTLANLSGPAFLALYLSCFIVLAILLRLTLSLTAPLPDENLPIPTEPDPFQIAYMRGGPPELLRTTLVDLVEKGRIKEVAMQPKWYHFGAIRRLWTISNAADLGRDLPVIHRLILDHFRHQPYQLDTSVTQLLPQVQPHVKPLQTWLQHNGLTLSSSEKFRVGALTFSAIALFDGIGLYKLFAALSHNRFNIGFLIFGMICGSILLLMIGQRHPLTERGRAFLRDLRTAFDSIKSPTGRSQTAEAAGSPLSGHSSSLLAMSIFGAIALQNSEFDSLFHSFGPNALAASQMQNNSAMTSSGCGSGGCSSGGGSGGGCGSGGCGGGGCGGCGGG